MLIQRITILIAFFTCNFFIAFAQTPVEVEDYMLDHSASNLKEISINQLLNPTPAAFVEHGFFSVGHNTGNVKVGIPLYTIVDGDISVPISINYTQSSVKVNTIASNTGLGWSLDYGGQVSRLNRGMCDFGMSFYPGNYVSNSRPELPNHTYFGSYYADYGASTISPNVYSGPANEEKPDLYFYSINGKSNSFYFGPGNSINERVMSEDEVSFSLSSQASFIYNHKYIDPPSPLDQDGGSRTGIDIASFSVKNNSGLTYNFEEVESRINKRRGYVVSEVTKNNTTWYLSSVESQNTGKTLTFIYESIGVDNLSNSGVDFIETNSPNERDGWEVPSRDYYEANDLGYGGYDIPNNCKPAREDFIVCGTHENEIKRIKKIQFSEGIIEFVYLGEARLDLTSSNALEKILVKNNAGEVVKQFVFSYDYFRDPDTDEKSKLKLLSIAHMDKDDKILAMNEFDYNKYAAHQNSLKQDLYGFYNASADFIRNVRVSEGYGVDPVITYEQKNSMIPTTYKYSSLPAFEQHIPFPIIGLIPMGEWTGRDRSVNVSTVVNGLLASYTTSEGGRIKFEYEPNKFLFNGYEVFGPGSRIRQQVIDDGNGNARSLVYTYELENGTSSGQINVFPWMSFYCVNSTNPLERRSSPFFNIQSNYKTGFEVNYTRVIKEEEGNGKTVYSYTGEEQDVGTLPDNFFNDVNGLSMSTTQSYFPFSFERKLFLRGILKNVKTYKSIAQGYELVEEQIMENQLEYQNRNISVSTPIFIDWPTWMIDYSINYTNQKKIYSNITSKAYNESDVFSIITNSFYESLTHPNITKIVSNTSNSSSEIVELRYLSDLIQNGGPAELEYAFINNYNPIIESVTYWEDSDDNRTRVSGQINTLQIKNDLVKPFKGYVLDKKTYSTFTPITLSSTTINKDNSYYQIVDYTAFDTQNRLIEVKDQVSGVFSCIIYGEEGIIAEISNAKSEEIGFSSFETIDVVDWNKAITASYIKNDPHTGNNSLLIGGGETRWGPKHAFSPEDQNGKYIFSFWAKKQANYLQNSGRLNYELKNLDGSDLPVSYWTDKFIEVSEDFWTYNEIIIDLKKIREENPTLTQNVQIIVRSYQTTNPSVVNKGFFVDDIRFHPIDAKMTSYTSIPLVGVTSISNSNSIPTFYEYNSSNEMELIRDFNNNAIQVYEKANYSCPLVEEFYFSSIADINFFNGAGTEIVSDFTNGKWMYRTTVDWILVSKLNNNLVIQFEENLSGPSRNTSIEIIDCYGDAHTIIVNQSASAGPCPSGGDLVFSYNWVNGSTINALGDEKSISVLSNAMWSIVSGSISDSWFTPTFESQNLLKVSAAENIGPIADIRLGTFKIEDCQGNQHTIQVTQLFHP